MLSKKAKAISAITAAITTVAGVGIAAAIPPGGAENTPGTEVVIDSASAIAGQGWVIGHFTGFPTKDTKYGIKIDDGRGYSNTHIHGTGNLASGTNVNGDSVTFAIQIPCAIDQSINNHWIRILALGPDGKHYSSKSVNTFQVTDFHACH